MKRRIAPLLAALAFLAAGSLRAAAADSHIFIYWDAQLDRIVKTQEAKRPRIDELLSRLSLKPGMTILDIGAGTGQQSYKMAEALKGTGRVYAADIEPRLVDYVKAQARARGLKNLEPVLVKADGFDGFYSRHTYDLVLLYDVVSFIHDRADYFARLRKCLAPGGRVVIVGQPNELSYSFTRDDFSDWDGFLADLKREPADSVFGRALAEPVRAGLADLPRATDAERERVALFHLNRNLNGELFASFTDGLELTKELPVTPGERVFASWLLRRLDLAGIPGKRDHDEILSIEMRDVVMINKLALISRYRRYLKSDPPHPYLPAGMEFRWLSRHSALSRELAAAGYKMVSGTQFVPFQQILIYSAAAASR